MNTYLPYLPCLKDSNVTTPKTECMNWPFSQYALDVIVLRACPSAWGKQYYLLRQSLLTKLVPLHDTLGQIKKVQVTKISDSDTSKPGDKGGTNKKTRFSENLKCRKGDGHKVYHISKKAHNEHSVSAGRNVTGPIRPITLRNATYMPKMAWHNLCTLQKREGMHHVSGSNAKEGCQIFTQLKAEMVDIKAEVERHSKKKCKQ